MKPAENPSHPLTSWLDNLQQESWQLELLISGFAIFLLIGGYGPLVEASITVDRLMLQSESYRVLLISYYILRTAYLVLLICLIIHVLLRGLWIAAIGLRYVSGDIDYESLGYQPTFSAWLARSMGSFDRYIERLERLCSVLFSVAFLIIFCFVSLVGFTLFAVAVQWSVTLGVGIDWQNSGLFGGGVTGLVLLVLALVYFIDFLTLGFLKRNRFTARVYYPVYRFMGWVTLAGLYRPLYHNLVDNSFGRWFARLLPVFIVVALVAVSVRLNDSPYFPAYDRDGLHAIEADNYDDTAGKITDLLRRPTLNSKYPVAGYLELFVPYLPKYNDRVIRHTFPDLAVSRYAGIKLRGAFSVGTLYNAEADYPALLEAMRSLHRLRVDEQPLTGVRPRFHFHPEREQPGLLYVLPTRQLGPGEHTLLLETAYLSADTLQWGDYGAIYFYN